MAEQLKLNNIAKAKSKHQQDMAALQSGAAQSGSLMAPSAPVPKTPGPEIPLGEMADIEDDISKTQAGNLEKAKTNPGMQDKLNAVAKARAKFYGEGI